MSDVEYVEALESALARVTARADVAIAEYRTERHHGDGGWGEHLCEALEEILTTARR